MFSYQSAPGSPAVLTLLVTRQGTSVSVIESDLHQDMITSSVPEPSTYMLMIAGLLASAEISRRKRRHA